MPGCVGSNIALPTDAGSAQDLKVQNPLQSSRLTHDPVLSKVFSTFQISPVSFSGSLLCGSCLINAINLQAF